MSKTLVTGDTGFVGQHVLAKWQGAVGLSALSDHIDIRDKSGLTACLRTFQPTAVLHLAALSFVPESFRHPGTTFDVNFFGTLRLLEALAETGFKGRFVFVGTGDAYGLVSSEDLPLEEDRPLRPRSPYAVSKVAAEALCYQWSQTGPFDVLIARPFNHIGAGQSQTFAISDFARQLAEIAAGRCPPQLHVGNIDVTRDFTDVADVVRAYAMLLERGQNGEIYNVCSGVERSVRFVLDRLIELSGVQAEVIGDPARQRPSEQPRVCGSYKKLHSHTGWQPAVSLDASLLSVYRYWENLVV